MKFQIHPDHEYKLVDVSLRTSKHGFGVVELQLEDIHTGIKGKMDMAIMDWDRINKQVKKLLEDTYEERLANEPTQK